MNTIFVFGSNLAGRHGAGAALNAIRQHGAIYGQGIGKQGNSYAIPTKDANLKTLSLSRIKKYVNQFLDYAEEQPDLTFQLTAIGCGLAGYDPRDIAPMFKNATANISLPDSFVEILTEDE